MNYIFLYLSFLIPLTAGCLLSAIGGKLSLRSLAVYVNTICAITLFFVCLTFIGGNFNITLLKLTDTVGITLGSDGLSRLFVSIISVVWLIVSVYANTYMRNEENKIRFFSFFLIVLGMLMLLSFSANLFTLFLFFELMTLTSVPLVFHRMTHKAIDAGIKYLIYSAAGAICALFGVIIFYKFGAALVFELGGMLDQTLSLNNKNMLLAAAFVSVIGFGTIAGMFPLHTWLNTAYPTAPTPASAILSGVITNAGIFCVIRVVYFTVGVDFLRGTWVQCMWIILALITIIIGSVMAYREKLLKKSLAYWTISQVSHGMLGLAIMNNTAVNGALLHVIFQSVIISGLFLTAGAFCYKTGLQNSEDLKSMGRHMPITMFCFTLLSLALIGFPPMSGFMSKWYLALGALESNLGALSWITPVVLLLNTLLTAGYLFQIIISGYFPGNDSDKSILPDIADPEKTMLIPIFILASVSVILGINASPIIDTVKSLILK